MEIVLILHNIRSTYNVGSILRTADGFSVNQIIYSGFTPAPIPHSTLLPHLAEKVTNQIHKTALGAEKTLKSSYSQDIIESIRTLKAQGYQIVGLENNLEDTRLHQITEHSLPNILGSKVALILGEEVEGISPKLHQFIDLFLEIPMTGNKESFNVSIASAITLFYLRYGINLNRS